MRSYSRPITKNGCRGFLVARMPKMMVLLSKDCIIFRHHNEWINCINALMGNSRWAGKVELKNGDFYVENGDFGIF